MNAAARAVGKEATRYARKDCRVCNGSGVLRVWAEAPAGPNGQRRKMLTPSLCGCAIDRLRKKKGAELEEVADPERPDAPRLLCWKIGYTPKDKQRRILEEESNGRRADTHGSV